MMVDPSLRQLSRRLISGREIFICDQVACAITIARVAQLLKILKYRRSEFSRSGAEVSGATAEVPDLLLGKERLFELLKTFGEEMFPNERFRKQRVYVNNSVYGDMYFPHRDCNAGENNVTVLYFANSTWNKDWGGETIFYNDKDDAEVVISPRPGRVIAFRGAILHRGGVPSRLCYEERLTVAYKLAVAD